MRHGRGAERSQPDRMRISATLWNRGLHPEAHNDSTQVQLVAPRKCFKPYESFTLLGAEISEDGAGRVRMTQLLPSNGCTAGFAGGRKVFCAPGFRLAAASQQSIARESVGPSLGRSMRVTKLCPALAVATTRHKTRTMQN